MIKFYNFQKVQSMTANLSWGQNFQTLSGKLSWSHYCELLYMKDLHNVEYYINIVVEQNLFVRQFYNLFSNEKVSAMPTQLTWNHYIVLI